MFLKTLYINHRHLSFSKIKNKTKTPYYKICVRGNVSSFSSCFSAIFIFILSDNFWSNVYFKQQFLLIVLKSFSSGADKCIVYIYMCLCIFVSSYICRLVRKYILIYFYIIYVIVKPDTLLTHTHTHCT